MRTIIITVLCTSLATAIIQCHKHNTSETSHHDHGEASESVSQTGAVFKTDKVLQERMAKINNLMLTLHNAKADKAKVAKDLEATVQDIFATCKLEPAADKVLHAVLANVLSGVQALKKKDEATAMEKLHAGLGLYEKRFSPTGW